MTLSGRITSASDGALGFDTNTSISLAVAQQFRGDGFRFCLRYLSLGAGQQAGDLTTAEANHILDGGLASCRCSTYAALAGRQRESSARALVCMLPIMLRVSVFLLV